MPRPLSARRESGRGDEDALRAHGVKTRGCANDRLAPKLPHPESWRRSRRELCGNAPAERGRGLPSGKNLVFLYLCAPNSVRLARNRESCSAPRVVCQLLVSRLRLRGAGFSPPEQTQHRPEPVTSYTIGITRPSPAFPLWPPPRESGRARPRPRGSAPRRARSGGRP